MIYNSAFGQFMSSVFGNFDISIFSFFGSIQNDFFTLVANFFTSLGESSFMVMLLLLSCTLILFKKTRKIGLLLLLSSLMFVVVNNLVLKNAFQRLRPYNALQGNAQFFQWYLNAGQVAESVYCFPSGHTTFAFTVCTTLFLWIRFEKNKNSAWFIFIVPVFVGCSRIYLMVHYPTDVIAGAIEGVIIAVLVWFAYRLFEKLNTKIIKNDSLKVKHSKNNSYDMEKFLEKKLGRPVNNSKVIAIIVVLVLCFSVASFSKYNLDKAKIIRCEHQGPDYICMNEADHQLKDENGDIHNYCKLHD